MEYITDQLSIDTPELVAIEMPLAGIGSRFIALLVDYVIWFIGMIVLIVILSFVMPAIHTFSRLSEQWAFALITFFFFLVNWGYFTLFEAFWNGRTPGKRVAKIRVIQKSGRAIGLFESMARNFVRFVDQFPFCYAVGLITMFCTKQYQRLGDLVAGTLVVRDNPIEMPLWNQPGSFMPYQQQAFRPEPHTLLEVPVSGIARLTSSDLQVLEGFFARRLDMSFEVRLNLAERIAAAIRAKSGLEPPPGASAETFLEIVARQLRDIARMR